MEVVYGYGSLERAVRVTGGEVGPYGRRQGDVTGVGVPPIVLSIEEGGVMVPSTTPGQWVVAEDAQITLEASGELTATVNVMSGVATSPASQPLLGVQATWQGGAHGVCRVGTILL